MTTYLRDGPSVQYRPVDEAQTDTRVAVNGCADGWCKVTYGGVSGYVAQGLLTPAADRPVSWKDPACVTASEAGHHGGRDLRVCPAQKPSP